MHGLMKISRIPAYPAKPCRAVAQPLDDHVRDEIAPLQRAFDHQQARFERAAALEPYFPDLWLHFRAQALYQLGRYSEAMGLLKRRILRNPETDVSRVLLAASYGQMGLIDEAREAWREALAINPAYSLEQRRNVMPYKNPADFERIVDGLRKAGLP